MKTKLFFLSLVLASAIALAQVSANQVDDFEDGTTQNWIIGSPSSAVSPPEYIATDGPDGLNDGFLAYTSTPPPTGGAGSKMVMFSAGAQWSSNFISEGVVAVKFDVRVLTNDLNLRIAFQGPNGKRICTTNAVNVIAGSGWQPVIIPVTTSDFTVISGSTDVSITDALSNVNTMRILSSNTPTWVNADTVISTINLDNITASTTLSTQDLSINNNFEISPNPSNSILNINLSQDFNNATITVYDVLGKKVHSSILNNLSSSINVTNWNLGIYLVRINTGTKSFTKRFVKN